MCWDTRRSFVAGTNPFSPQLVQVIKQSTNMMIISPMNEMDRFRSYEIFEGSRSFDADRSNYDKIVELVNGWNGIVVVDSMDPLKDLLRLGV